MKNKIMLILIWFCTCAGAFVAGQRIEKSISDEKNEARSQYLDIINASANYSFLSNLAQQIVSQKYSAALCSVNLVASAKVNEVRNCLQSQKCSALVEAEVVKIAPELHGQGELKIKYYKPNELCKP